MAYETVGPVADTHHNLVGLARVSTGSRDAQLQRDALSEAGCGRIFEEKISTRKTERPGLAAALDYLRPGDTLCVWKLGRLGRSVKDVLIIAGELHERGIGVRILTGKLAGTYTPSGEGKFFFTMMAAFAELERDIIHERAMTGLAAARAQGRTGGRPTVMNGDKLAAARARHASGQSPTQIAKALGVSRATIYRHLAATPNGQPRDINNSAPSRTVLTDLRQGPARRPGDGGAAPGRRRHRPPSPGRRLARSYG